MSERMTVAVYGAAGHTGRFVVAELKRRGHSVIRIGRDAARLQEARAGESGEVSRVAQVDDAAQLDAALRGAHAVINCAGPFMDTALPIADAALRAGIHYLDVTAEQPVFQSLAAQRDASARAAGVTLVPAAAFYGGLADLLVTSSVNAAAPIDSIEIAVGLDSWHPTRGTRVTGERNRAPRLIQRHGELTPMPQPVGEGRWAFPEPLGDSSVMMIPFTEVLAIARHLRVDTIESWLAALALRDIRNPDTPPPKAHDAQGRSAQRFIMDIVIAQAGGLHRVTAAGQDIYAVSAPIVVEAAERLMSGRTHSTGGVTSLGEIFDAADFLAALDTVTVDRAMVSGPVLMRNDLSA